MIIIINALSSSPRIALEKYSSSSNSDPQCSPRVCVASLKFLECLRNLRTSHNQHLYLLIQFFEIYVFVLLPVSNQFFFIQEYFSQIFLLSRVYICVHIYLINNYLINHQFATFAFFWIKIKINKTEDNTDIDLPALCSTCCISIGWLLLAVGPAAMQWDIDPSRVEKFLMLPGGSCGTAVTAVLKPVCCCCRGLLWVSNNAGCEHLLQQRCKGAQRKFTFCPQKRVLTDWELTTCSGTEWNAAGVNAADGEEKKIPIKPL